MKAQVTLHKVGEGSYEYVNGDDLYEVIVYHPEDGSRYYWLITRRENRADYDTDNIVTVGGDDTLAGVRYIISRDIAELAEQCQRQADEANAGLPLPEFSAKVLETLHGLLDWQDSGFSDVDGQVVADAMGVSAQAVGGALGHLVERNLVEIEEWRSNGVTQFFIHLVEAD